MTILKNLTNKCEPIFLTKGDMPLSFMKYAMTGGSPTSRNGIERIDGMACRVVLVVQREPVLE